MSLHLLKTKTGAYLEICPEAKEYAEVQASIAWPPDEFPVEEDIQDVLTNFEEAERHPTVFLLKLFTHYELKAGVDYWATRILNKYQCANIQRMASTFAFAELGMHAPFYAALNKALHLDTIEFYTSYVNDKVLSERMEFIDNLISDEDDALSVGVFSLIEGAVLYSSFAFLKHFRANGKNKLKNLVSGINSSVRDENLHSEAGAWLFNLELKYQNKTHADYEKKIRDACDIIFAHESAIIEKMFSKGKIHGITEKQLRNFVKSRINICLSNLGYSKQYDVTYNPIADWFYDSINSVKVHDFFNTSNGEYRRDWNEDKLLINWG